jgi:hypothetical protein
MYKAITFGLLFTILVQTSGMLKMLGKKEKKIKIFLIGVGNHFITALFSGLKFQDRYFI